MKKILPFLFALAVVVIAVCCVTDGGRRYFSSRGENVREFVMEKMGESGAIFNEGPERECPEIRYGGNE